MVTLQDARRIIAAAEKKAAEIVRVEIAVPPDQLEIIEGMAEHEIVSARAEA